MTMRRLTVMGWQLRAARAYPKTHTHTRTHITPHPTGKSRPSSAAVAAASAKAKQRQQQQQQQVVVAVGDAQQHHSLLDSNNFARLLTSSTRLNAVPPLSASTTQVSSSTAPVASKQHGGARKAKGSRVPTYYVADVDEDEDIEGERAHQVGSGVAPVV